MTRVLDIADLYRRRTGFDGPPLDNYELQLLIENTRETEESLSARGPFWGLATSTMRSELDSLVSIARARGMKP